MNGPFVVKLTVGALVDCTLKVPLLLAAPSLVTGQTYQMPVLDTAGQVKLALKLPALSTVAVGALGMFWTSGLVQLVALYLNCTLLCAGQSLP